MVACSVLSDKVTGCVEVEKVPGFGVNAGGAACRAVLTLRTALLPRAVGLRKAREMSSTGAFVDAEDALRLGLVNHLVSHEELLPFTIRLAAAIAPTSAVGEILSLYDRGADLDLSGALALETAYTAKRRVSAGAFADAGKAFLAGR